MMYKQKQLVNKQLGRKSETDFDDWSFEEDSALSINVIQPTRTPGTVDWRAVFARRAKDPVADWRRLVIALHKKSKTKLSFNSRTMVDILQPDRERQRPVIVNW